MPRLFSYGSLQQPAVQRRILGRQVPGSPDEVIGFERVMIHRTGKELANIVRNGRADSLVIGTVFEISEAELLVVDAYEAADSYVRMQAVLASGGQAWVYAEVAR